MGLVLEQCNFLQSLSNETNNFSRQRPLKAFKRIEDASQMYLLRDFRQNKTRNTKFSLRPVVYVTVEFSEESVFHRTTESQKQYDNLDCREVIHVLSSILPSVVLPYPLEDHLVVCFHELKRISS